MSKLENKLAALDVWEDAAIPGEGERDAAAALHWGTDEAERALFSSNNEREMRLWPGSLLRDKRLLQRDFPVFYVDAKGHFAGRRTAWIAVGSKTVDVETFRLMAERERRIAAAKTGAA
jgi:hypothetical protein